jgi:hypothetical protein
MPHDVTQCSLRNSIQYRDKLRVDGTLLDLTGYSGLCVHVFFNVGVFRDGDAQQYLLAAYDGLEI